MFKNLATLGLSQEVERNSSNIEVFVLKICMHTYYIQLILIVFHTQAQIMFDMLKPFADNLQSHHRYDLFQVPQSCKHTTFMWEPTSK